MNYQSQPFYREICPEWQDYELLDSGNRKVLERFGKTNLIRPYPQAFWPKSAPELWKTNTIRFVADNHEFGGNWQTDENTQKSWPLRWNKIRFQTQLGSSQHIGIFPEEISHWLWLEKTLQNTHKPVKLLNLFAYTGLINLIASQNGAEVTHVDSSKHAIGWSMANQKLSGMKEAPIRYIQEEPIKFIKREARREQHYNAIILQFPRFSIEQESSYAEFLKQLSELVQAIQNILDPHPLCLLITAPDCIHPETTHAIANNLVCKKGKTISGKLSIKEKSAGSLLPRASFTRWNCEEN